MSSAVSPFRGPIRRISRPAGCAGSARRNRNGWNYFGGLNIHYFEIFPIFSLANEENIGKNIVPVENRGPSIPKAFGVSECASADEEGIYPAVTESGIQIMSVNLLLEHEDDPVLWRGPIIAGAVKQFWTDVVWENVDYLFVDMPPGTGDVPLTVFQSLPVDGIVIVTSPQELVSMIVAKAVRMAEMMHVPVIGLVENYSYFRCPDCGKCHQIFGKSHLDETAQAYHLPVLARLPIDPAVAEACDAGRVESLDTTELEPALQAILAR